MSATCEVPHKRLAPQPLEDFAGSVLPGVPHKLFPGSPAGFGVSRSARRDPAFQELTLRRSSRRTLAKPRGPGMRQDSLSRPGSAEQPAPSAQDQLECWRWPSAWALRCGRAQQAHPCPAPGPCLCGLQQRPLRNLAAAP
eukprot:769279-Amphidinium_carterae.1